MAAVHQSGVVSALLLLGLVAKLQAVKTNFVTPMTNTVRSIPFCSAFKISTLIEERAAILNITTPQCSAIGEVLVLETYITPTASPTAPLGVATVPLVFPTVNVAGFTPTFSDLPTCAVRLPIHN